MDYAKVKSVAKQIQCRGPALEKTILETMRTISSIVGGTLGPGGRQVLIERQEFNLPPMVTKDGVTVFRSLGFDAPAAHCVMEAARDAAVRTASEAGDGTTTATILAESIVRKTKEFCASHGKVSPQKVVRRLERAFKEVIDPLVHSLAYKADLSTTEGRLLLRNVARISANGDTDLADAVMKCYDLVGDDGNVTIAEVNGPSHYEVEKIDGFPISMGYEDACGKFYPKFINDNAGQRCFLEKPIFLLYHGKVTEFQSLLKIMDLVYQEWQANGTPHNVVLVATGFSEQVLTFLAFNFPEQTSLNIFPLLVPQFPFANGQLYFLEDLAAITGAKVLDPLNETIEHAMPEDLGPGVVSFEANRFRSNIVGSAAAAAQDPTDQQELEDLILMRVDELNVQLSKAESQLEQMWLQERIGKLTGGIARLKVIGVSNGELKEKRDRAEDAVCGVRGAIKHGALPGGGWTLLRIMHELSKQYDTIITEVLIPALYEPVKTLFENAGINEEETKDILEPIISRIGTGEARLVYDVLEGKHVDPLDGGVLDSTPAVLEAIRNSISIATLLGTLGGTCVYRRDLDLERSEARDTAAWVRDANSNPADEHA